MRSHGFQGCPENYVDLGVEWAMGNKWKHLLLRGIGSKNCSEMFWVCVSGLFVVKKHLQKLFCVDYQGLSYEEHWGGREVRDRQGHHSRLTQDVRGKSTLGTETLRIVAPPDRTLRTLRALRTLGKCARGRGGRSGGWRRWGTCRTLRTMEKGVRDVKDVACGRWENGRGRGGRRTLRTWRT